MYWAPQTVTRCWIEFINLHSLSSVKFLNWNPSISSPSYFISIFIPSLFFDVINPARLCCSQNIDIQIFILALHFDHSLFHLSMSFPVPCVSVGVLQSSFVFFPIPLFPASPVTTSEHGHLLSCKPENVSLLTKAVTGNEERTEEGKKVARNRRWDTKSLLSCTFIHPSFLSSLFLYEQYLWPCPIHTETNLEEDDCMLYATTVPSVTH